LPLSVSVLDSGEKVPVLLMMTLLIFVRHKDNIRRLIKGTEPRIGAQA